MFVVLFAAAIFYEIVAAVQHRGNTISEMVWDLFAAQPIWRYVLVAVCLHFLLGARAYNAFLKWFK
jgi:hypothetical protein